MTELISSSLWMTLVVFLGFLFHWISVLFEWKRIKPFAKAFAMILVIVWTFYFAHFEANYQIIILLAAQAFGLLGDILLLFPGKWFVWGLGAFMIGHFFYLGLLFDVLFTSCKGEFLKGSTWVIALIGLVLWFSYLFFFMRFLSPYIFKNKSDLPFWSAVVFYGAVLSFIVVFSAWCVYIIPGYSWIRLCLPIGAALFFVSDNILAYDRFVKKIRYGRLWVIVTYHLGQFNLAVGFLSLLGYLSTP